jgi:thiol-disulfide isomerase/thioredoxin
VSALEDTRENLNHYKGIIVYMISGKHSHTKQPRGFWTTTRLTLTSLALAAVAVVASGCGDATQQTTTTDPNSNTTTTAQTARTPTITIKNGTATNNASAPASTSSTTSSAPTDPAALEAMPESVMARDVQILDGKSLKLSDYKGKVLVVDLWATWCGPCRQSIPHLIELRNEFKPNQLEIIGLTTEDPTTDEAKVRAFSKQFNINYKIGWVEDDMAITLMRGRNAIPQAMVITKDGKLLKHLIGFSPVSSPQTLRTAIEQAMKMPG